MILQKEVFLFQGRNRGGGLRRADELVPTQRQVDQVLGPRQVHPIRPPLGQVLAAQVGLVAAVRNVI